MWFSSILIKDLYTCSMHESFALGNGLNENTLGGEGEWK